MKNKNKKNSNFPNLRFPGFEDEWEEKKLGEVAEIQMCKRIFANQTSEKGEIPFYKIGTLGNTPDTFISRSLFDNYKEMYNYPVKGEVLITCAGTIGKCVVFDGNDSYFQDSNIVWISNSETVIKNKFIYHILSNTNWSKLNSTTITRIYNDNLRSLYILYPTKIEQEKVTLFLSLIDERILTQIKIIEEWENYMRGIREAIFSQKIRFKDKDGSNFPEWKEKKVGDIFEVTRGNVLAINLLSSEKSQEKPYPVYSSQTKNKGLAGYHNDFLFQNAITWTTDGANAGDVNYREGKFYCTNVCGVLLNTEGYANICISELINSVSKKYVSYVGNPKLMNGVMSKIKILFPSLEEQTKIALFFSSIKNKLEMESQLLIEYQDQKKYFLQNLFI